MAKAIDGNPLSSWSFQLDPSKAGVVNVGLVIRLKHDQNLRAITLATDTPGMTVAFYGSKGKPPASFPNAGWFKLAGSANIPASATVDLNTHGRTFDDLLVFIMHAPPGVNIGQVDISELSLMS